MAAELPYIDPAAFRQRLEGCSPEHLSQTAQRQLYLHYSELRRWNRRVSLVGPGRGDEIVERHYGESLAGLELVGVGREVVVDVGSGAGFPGLVLAIARPELAVTLVESRERKWSFLMTVCRKASLSCRCVNARVGAAPARALPPEIDRITSRAVKTGDLGLEQLLPRLTPRGAVLLWAGIAVPEVPAVLELTREAPIAGDSARRILEFRRRGDRAREP